ncbi:MAG: methyltransferase [Acidobacteria bacterium RIFCSPLOWO2_02_FULL_59_13]|nr:MAG: methyltransferase [Acidobacteria bacterium RIFCSPLOWO2_02_FULL_59_13]
MYRKIDKCRICGNSRLAPVVDLGEQTLTGVFPRKRNQEISRGPLRLVKCENGTDRCGLLQLQHSYEHNEMYGANYGYRSGINSSMVRHLHDKVETILQLARLRSGDLVVDIGSNDGTTLGAFPEDCLLVGIDPTGNKFREFYRADIRLIPDFFSAEVVKRAFPGRRAKVVTSFSMFYDLEQPLHFMREVAEVMDDDGIWVFEQSYMPAMLERNAYDTICHEHLEYYALHQVQWLVERAGFKILDVEFNDVNGGSFSVTAAKRASSRPVATERIADALERERAAGLSELAPYVSFARRVEQSRDALCRFLQQARSERKSVFAIGASTKGNVVLQYCGITGKDIAGVGEVNPDKFGSFTPGTLLPIHPEDEVLARRPDYLLVLPWHFREFFVRNPKFRGFRLVFPLPTLEQVMVQ